MRICRFDQGRIGLVSEGTVIDVTDRVAPLLASLRPGPGDPLVRCLPAVAAIDRSGCPVRPLAGLALESPVALPNKIVAAPVNYRAHVAEANADPGIVHGHTITDIGTAGLFLKANSSLAGPSAGVAIRFPDRRTDHEVELVVVIGRGGSDIPAAAALEHVAGYAVGIDVTLRGPEDRSFRKSIDGYSVVGPWLTTADEVVDPDRLDLSLSVNGERRQAANTGAMVYGVARLIEFASSFYTLHPGDLLFTGTPEGVGPIRSGDRIEATVEGLGTIVTDVRVHATTHGSLLGAA